MLVASHFSVKNYGKHEIFLETTDNKSSNKKIRKSTYSTKQAIKLDAYLTGKRLPVKSH